MTLPDPAPLKPSSDVPAWQDFFALQEYRRALAAARLLHSPALGTLESLFSLQEALRLHRYPQAQRHLTHLAQDLAVCPDPAEAATLRQQLDPASLQSGLTALMSAQEQRLTDPEGLRVALASALAQPLTQAEALNVLGVCYAKAGLVAQARAELEAALRADPQHYRVLSNLGNLALEAGDLTGAEKYQREALALNPDYAGAHHNLGVVLRKQGKLSQSVTHLKKAQRLDSRAAAQEAAQDRPSNLPAWLSPQNMRLLGLLLAVVVFFIFLRPHH